MWIVYWLFAHDSLVIVMIVLLMVTRFVSNLMPRR